MPDAIMTLDIVGNVRSVFSINGRIESPVIKGIVYLEEGWLKDKGFEFMGIRAEIPVAYQEDSLSIQKASIKMDKARLIRNGVEYFIKNGIEISSQLIMRIPDALIKGDLMLNILNGGLSTPDGFIVSEGIRMQTGIGFELSYPFDNMGFIILGNATDFELLIGRFYGNFKEREIRFQLKGVYSEGSLKVSHSDLNWTTGGLC